MQTPTHKLNGDKSMLSDTKIKALKPKDKTFRSYDKDGVYLECTPSGGKLWRLKFRLNGKEKRFALGKYPEITLKMVRLAAIEARRLISQGIDPVAEKRKAEGKAEHIAKNTFEIWARNWLAFWGPEKSVNHVAATLRTLEQDVFPYIGSQAIAKLTLHDIKKCIERIAATPSASENKKKMTVDGRANLAKRVFTNISQIYRYSIIHSGGIVTMNPLGGFLPKDLITAPKTKNFARLSEKELPEFLQKIDTTNMSPLTRDALRILLYTFVRTNELIGMRWDEVDFQKNQWRLPAERMKTGKIHIVPLADQVMAILTRLREKITSDHVFSAQIIRKSPHMSNNTILLAIDRMGFKGRMTGHGCRGIASTLLHEQGFKHAHIELQLAHGEKDSTSASYNYAQHIPARIDMMQKWADFLDNQEREEVQ